MLYQIMWIAVSDNESSQVFDYVIADSILDAVDKWEKSNRFHATSEIIRVEKISNEVIGV